MSMRNFCHLFGEEWIDPSDAQTQTQCDVCFVACVVIVLATINRMNPLLSHIHNQNNQIIHHQSSYPTLIYLLLLILFSTATSNTLSLTLFAKQSDRSLPLLWQKGRNFQWLKWQERRFSILLLRVIARAWRLRRRYPRSIQSHLPLHLRRHHQNNNNNNNIAKSKTK